MYNWDLKKSAAAVIERMCNVAVGEDVLIYADTSASAEVVESLAEAAYIKGGIVSALWYETRPEVAMEPPAPLAAAMKAADVLIELAEKYLIHTEAYHEALKAGSRNLCLSGMTPEMMIRCIGRIDYDRMVELGDLMAQLLRSADLMRIETPAGTDLEFRIGGRPVFHNSGVISKPGEQSFLGGQVAWAPLEETINGVLVFDGSVWPPEEIGLLRTPIRMEIEKGTVKTVSGGAEAQLFERWLGSFNDANMFKIAHLSYGLNPGARLTGKILEDERIFGCIEVGLGSQRPRFKGRVGRAKAHTDGIMLNPTVSLDGKLIESEGKFVHKELAKVSEQF
jgi:2,5-dihydroxypyridine 5,6-dioxygenase